MADMAMGIAGNLGCKGKMPVKHIPGPEVRNSPAFCAAHGPHTKGGL